MSQNGPYTGLPWSGGSSDEPYTEPADPWREQGMAEPGWGADPPPIPHQPFPSAHPSGPHRSGPHDPMGPSSGWGSPARTRNTPIILLLVLLGLLVTAGLGTTVWLVKRRHDRPTALPQASASAAAPAPVQGSADVRFVPVGQCVTNEGTDEEPLMRRTPCTTGAYQVLKVFKGKTTGEKDAEHKCSKAPGYTNWFFYDSDFDDLDLVLCLRRR